MRFRARPQVVEAVQYNGEMGARVEHYLSKLWNEAERPPEIPPGGGTIRSSRR